MKFVSLFIAFCFSLNVMASTGTIQELERHIDDYNYALSVEWDQKDNAFYEAQTKVFFSQLEKLIKEEGLTQKEIMTLLETKTKNKAALNALKLKLTVLSQGASAEELAGIIKDASKDLYTKGASWNGEVVIGATVGIIIVGLIAYSVWWDHTHKCVAYEPQYVCYTYDSCYNSYYYGCYGGMGTTYCGYEDVCTRYEKK